MFLLSDWESYLENRQHFYQQRIDELNGVEDINFGVRSDLAPYKANIYINEAINSYVMGQFRSSLICTIIAAEQLLSACYVNENPNARNARTQELQGEVLFGTLIRRYYTQAPSTALLYGHKPDFEWLRDVRKVLAVHMPFIPRIHNADYKRDRDRIEKQIVFIKDEYSKIRVLFERVGMDEDLKRAMNDPQHNLVLRDTGRTFSCEQIVSGEMDEENEAREGDIGGLYQHYQAVESTAYPEVFRLLALKAYSMLVHAVNRVCAVTPTDSSE